MLPGPVFEGPRNTKSGSAADCEIPFQCSRGGQSLAVVEEKGEYLGLQTVVVEQGGITSQGGHTWDARYCR